MAGPGQLLSQQAQRLLEDTRQENRMLEEAVTTLKEQVNIYEQEVDQVSLMIHLSYTYRMRSAGNFGQGSVKLLSFNSRSTSAWLLSSINTSHFLEGHNSTNL